MSEMIVPTTSAIYSPIYVRFQGWLYNPHADDPKCYGIVRDQLTPIAIDLTLDCVRYYPYKGTPADGEHQSAINEALRNPAEEGSGECVNYGALLDNSKRKLPKYVEEMPSDSELYLLAPREGFYEICVQEKVRLDRNVMALCYLRSSLYRCGIFPSSGTLYDPGYEGPISTFVKPTLPVLLHKKFRPLSMIFLKCPNARIDYQSFWQVPKQTK